MSFGLQSSRFLQEHAFREFKPELVSKVLPSLTFVNSGKYSETGTIFTRGASFLRQHDFSSGAHFGFWNKNDEF